jgi:5'-3' exonuclease
MGVKCLNKFLKQYCTLRRVHLNNLEGMKIAIDTQNFLYQIIQGDLIKNLERFCKVLTKYNILPYFVFDGKPPQYKLEIIEQRRKHFKDCSTELERMLQMDHLSENDKIRQLYLEKQTHRLTYKKIVQVKSYLDKRNIKYVIPNDGVEADDVCVDMCNNNEADAVISEDMDIVGSGCNKVVRSIDIEKETCIIYNLESILIELNLSKDNFKKMCHLSSTYNKKSNITVFDAIKLVR